jgi:hypothetical protein
MFSFRDYFGHSTIGQVSKFDLHSLCTIRRVLADFLSLPPRARFFGLKLRGSREST